MTEELKNAGYTIIESFTVGEQGFALGHSDTAPAPYVTWKYHAAAPNHFFWGHYVSTKEAAYEDYWNRINSEIEAVSERTGQAPFHGIIHHKALNPILLYGFLVTGLAALGVYTFVVIVDYAHSARSAFTYHERAAFAAIEFGCQQIIDLGFLSRGRFLVLFQSFLYAVK